MPTKNGVAKKPSGARVVEFAPQELRVFELAPSFSAFLQMLRSSANNPVAMSHATTAWRKHKSRFAKDSALEEFCGFLEAVRFTSCPKQDAAARDPLDTECAKEAARIIVDALPRRLDQADPCFYFPAGQRLFAELDSYFGSLNPVSVIAGGFQAIYGSADDAYRVAAQNTLSFELTSALRRLLREVCVWVASSCDRETRTAVRACLLMVCGTDTRCNKALLKPGDPRTILAAICVSPALRRITLAGWARAIDDYESDDRLVEGLDVLCQFRLRGASRPAAKVRRAAREIGFSIPLYLSDVIPTETLGTAVACLYCRWLSGKDSSPAFAAELPRLFRELREMGFRDGEGKSPITSHEAYTMGHTLDTLERAADLDTEAWECEYLVCGRAVANDRGFEPDYFDVVEYVAGGERPWQRFHEYRRLAAAANALGLHEMAAAVWSFFLISQSAAFQGQLKASWEDLGPLLRDALDSPGAEYVAAGIRFAAEMADERKETVNALRLWGLLPRESQGPIRGRSASLLRFRPPDPRNDAEVNLQRLVGADGWGRLMLETREHFVDGWIQARQSRPKPVNPDIQNWGPSILHFMQGLEHEVLARTRPIRVSPEVNDFFAGLGVGAKAPTTWTFGAAVKLLGEYRKFPPSLKKLVADGGLDRVCGDASHLIGRLKQLADVRNRAAHPEGRTLQEHELQRVLDELFNQGFVKQFAEALDPISTDAVFTP